MLHSALNAVVLYIDPAVVHARSVLQNLQKHFLEHLALSSDPHDLVGYNSAHYCLHIARTIRGL